MRRSRWVNVPPMEASFARRMWATLEPVHAMIYFVAEARDQWEKLGFTHPRMGYFGPRAAAMGRVGAPVVAATFYNFNPATVARFIPEVWDIADPARIVQARYRAADAALRRLLGDAVESEEMAWAAETALEATTACSPAGRPLFAAHAAVPPPDVAHLRLWHAFTLLREYRGDGHVHALMAAGLSGLEAVVSYSATGELFDAEFFQRSRGWSKEDWEAGEESLRARGWLDDDGMLTPEGRSLRQEIEDETNRLSLSPWQALGEETAQRLRGSVHPWTRAIIDADVIGGGGRNVRVYSDSR